MYEVKYLHTYEHRKKLDSLSESQNDKMQFHGK